MTRMKFLAGSACAGLIWISIFLALGYKPVAMTCYFLGLCAGVALAPNKD